MTNKQSMEVVTVTLDEWIVNRIQSANNKINEAVNTFGRIYVRRRELEEELNRLCEFEEKTNEDFKAANEEFRTYLSDLEKDYPNSQLDLVAGTITYTASTNNQFSL